MIRPTLTDVAKIAGVTPTTVSRVINNRGAISEHTKRKVHLAMEELNYQPNALARTLLGKQSYIVGLIFPTTANPFYAELIYYLEKNFSEKGYKVMLCNSMSDSDKERNFVKMILANQVDGLIVGSHNTDIEIYKKSGLPIISIDRVLSQEITVLSSDNYMGGQLATKYLYEKGSKKIAHINSLKADVAPYSHERRKGYLDYLENKAMEPCIFEIDYDLPFDVKKNIICGILELHPKIDGIFVADDMTAILVMNVCKKLNYAINIVGYDGSKEIINYFPELPTVQQPIKEMAEEAVKLLIAEITQESYPEERRKILPVKLIDIRK